MAFTDTGARQDALDDGADPNHVAGGTYVSGTLASLSALFDVFDGPERVVLAPDGRAVPRERRPQAPTAPGGGGDRVQPNPDLGR
jgi:hypothetical protein